MLENVAPVKKQNRPLCRITDTGPEFVVEVIT
jgi:hypothetical protein